MLDPTRPAAGPDAALQRAAWPPRLSPGTLTALAETVTTAGPRDALPVCAPFTGAQIGALPLCTEEDVDAAVARARAAQPAWAARPVAERTDILLRLHDLVLERQDQMMDLIQLESGKARLHAFEEVADVAIVARYYARRAAPLLAPRRRRGALPLLTQAREYHHPVGVVGLIAPWNYPLSMAITDALPALAAGNAVVLKPAEQTPYTALLGAALLYEAGLPRDLFQVVTGRGPTLGPPLIDRIDFLGFTGSTDTGRIVAVQAARRLIPCSLELGGKNPMLVLEDADLDRAVEGAVRGCFASAGQLCISIERIYAAAPVFDAFAERLAARVRQMRISATYTLGSDMGSLVSAEQLEKVEAHVRDAREKGADVITGGTRLPELGPLFYAPTLLSGVTEAMRMAREETFGPVVALYAFDDEEEALRRANDTAYGLNASIWTADLRRGTALARHIQAGTVNINEAYAAAWGSVDAPMGGFKASGLGRRHGAQGLLKYTEAQTVAAQRLLPIAPPGGLSEATYTAFLGRALQLMRRIPFLR